MADLNGKRLLLVGASGGLGAPIGRGLAAAGARVTLAGRDPARLRAVGLAQAELLTVDLADPEAGQRLVDAMVTGGGLDGVVFAAGVVAFGAAAELDDDVVDELLTINFLAPLRLTRAALPQLPPGGFVLSISAVVAERPVAGMSAYSASKAALSAFNASSRIEARRRRIRIIDARPPHTETGLAQRPIAGQAPKLPTGLDPQVVADRVVRALVEDEIDLPSGAFTDHAGTD